MSSPSSGLLRVPFVRRCTLRFADGALRSAFLVNINVLGAYVAQDDLSSPGNGGVRDIPEPGERVDLEFFVPGREGVVQVGCVVSWQNVRQQHPVHSLPPGFGVRFVSLSVETGRLIENVVRDYVAQRTR